ncbi:regulatory-associated protein of mTOR isoform X2 [Dendroctonus ponderosae]|uniref:Raptor N-terminal CASPase-like domain-containing protein n=1 Tax=Dendroctonus ponderosae TaxID=77166 RepID=A0AAR5QCK3_DENPD|nr:regulatory-associated protein of mTOR isoform X2 [Dendroctonus ponderosae]
MTVDVSTIFCRNTVHDVLSQQLCAHNSNMDEVAAEAWNISQLIDELRGFQLTDRNLPLAFSEERHLEKIDGIDWERQIWRMKERMKTVSVALVLCLNVGVDPPDIVKTQPCARLECWIDPLTMSGQKALDSIGQALQTQYERWQPRARYKQSLDPTGDDVKKLCLSLRRNAKEERVLFHYNGHGVPKPTTNGEIWVFNRTYTQYIPLSIYDLQTWMGAPSIYVYDCPNAGIIVESFKTYATQHELEYQQSIGASTSSRSSPSGSALTPSFSECIQLAACASNQCLPMNPDLPADLFTSCLTTPIKIAMRWCVLQPTSKLIPKITLDMVDKVPGNITDRKSMFGELNWIFTAITDTIAWNTLPRELFQKLFRQDLLVASLFRNFLLAERIMRSCDCTPVSSPALPSTYQHRMWDAWDLVLDLSFGQLPAILKGTATYKNLPFFEDELTAFEVWLGFDSAEENPPEQLPIVLQVLLSQVHRTRALELLGRFLDLGPWAVNLALSVGIFPYVLKLLQSFAKELRPLLVKIWSKILAVDTTCQADLIREHGHKYFLSILQDPLMSSETRTQATFVLSCLVTNYKDGQEAARQGSLVSVCLEQLGDPSPQLRQWVAICLGKLWDHYETARWTGVRDTAHEKLYILLKDPCPEVRAASVYALGTFINAVLRRSEHANNIDQPVGMTLANHAATEASPLVRKELINALQWLLMAFDVAFATVAAKETQSFPESQSSNTLPRIANRDRLSQPDGGLFRRVPSSPAINNMVNSPNAMTNSYSGSLGALPGLGYGSVYVKIWVALCQMETDPFPEVAQMCCTVTGYIRALVKERDTIDQRNSSISLPPSPNRGVPLSEENTPTAYQSGDFQTKLSRNSATNKNRRKKVSVDESTDKNYQNRKPLVTTNYVTWSSKQFVKKRDEQGDDPESEKYYEREWREIRNKGIRAEAHEEQKRAITSKVENQVFHSRTAVAPTMLQLHPYSQHIVVAGNDSFAIWDWGTGAKTTTYRQKSAINDFKTAKVSDLQWVNGHDQTLLLVAAEDGSVRIWRPIPGNREPSLVSAWQAFSNFKPKQVGVITSWEQWTQTVITTGDTKLLRLWDVQRELKYADIITGTDASVTCLDSSYSGLSLDISSLSHRRKSTENREPTRPNNQTGYIIAGCSDGSVRLFDRRCSPQESRSKVWMVHTGTVLAVQLQDNLVISGSSEGEVNFYDIRKNDALHSTNVIPKHLGMSCMSIHRSANIYACGSVNQFIGVYSLNGSSLNTIRTYEGFMSQKIGGVNCLNFHPHKVALAFGSADCCIDVYNIG